ncbi:hypothetical protein HOT75_gp092 [Gordonia phage Daredevil]|uniref:Uncharacterized protein n=1 Tax=Gordonia phage Daredevil TaxID=2283286 RepID=A0A345MIU8_9CAUD|nr:hypothetical protein HOT75_gp092 [Gordonia phage Daredevil]AXH70479.1 hypothetical protein SEA_DAREDEVIL_92 [Gordonia phage Daredevil]
MRFVKITVDHSRTISRVKVTADEVRVKVRRQEFDGPTACQIAHEVDRIVPALDRKLKGNLYLTQRCDTGAWGEVPMLSLHDDHGERLRIEFDPAGNAVEVVDRDATS